MQRSSLNLDNARATSDACLLFPRLSRPAIPGLEVTELQARLSSLRAAR